MALRFSPQLGIKNLSCINYQQAKKGIQDFHSSIGFAAFNTHDCALVNIAFVRNLFLCVTLLKVPETVEDAAWISIRDENLHRARDELPMVQRRRIGGKALTLIRFYYNFL